MSANKSSTTSAVALPCDQCTLSFDNGTVLAAHRRSKHAIPCTFGSCRRTFPGQEALKQHLDSAIHVNKQSKTTQQLNKASKELSPQVEPSKMQLNISNAPGTIPATNVEFLTPVVVGKTSRTLDSLAAHFESSLQISTPQNPAVQESPRSLRIPTSVIFGGERATCGTTPGKRVTIRSKVQSFDPQPAHKKTVIPQELHNEVFIALMAFCHSRYILHIYHTNIVKDANILMHYALPTPPRFPYLPERAAIAINCDVVDKHYSESEILHISAIDYLTGEVIIDALVQPVQPMAGWHTNQDWLSKQAKAATTITGRILKGWPEARAEIWRNIGPNTVLVGHNLHHDLTALRMEHWRVVDLAILVSEAVGYSVKRRWSLKALCNQLLNMKVQNNKGGGDSCIENAFAVREVVLWWSRHPTEVLEWATHQQKEWHKGVRQAYNERRTNERRIDERKTNVTNSDVWVWPTGYEGL